LSVLQFGREEEREITEKGAVGKPRSKRVKRGQAHLLITTNSLGN
jgi:hypothetical protein